MQKQGWTINTSAAIRYQLPGEALSSGTVKDLVAGSGLQFEKKGLFSLKGIPGEWEIYSVVN